MKKWQIGSVIAVSAVVGSLGSAVLWNGIAHGEWDFPGLNQQVQHLTEITTNHEARITNLENHVNTPAGEPTPTPQVVTRVITETAPTVAPTATSAPAPTLTPSPVPHIDYFWKHRAWDCAGKPTDGYEVSWSDGTSTYQTGRPTSGVEVIRTTCITFIPTVSN